MFLVPFTIMSACFPYVFHFAAWLIAFVPVYNFSFLDDVVFVLGHYQKFLYCAGTLKVNLDSCFVKYVLKLSLRPLEYGTTKIMLWFLLLILWRFV